MRAVLELRVRDGWWAVLDFRRNGGLRPPIFSSVEDAAYYVGYNHPGYSWRLREGGKVLAMRAGGPPEPNRMIPRPPLTVFL